MEEIDIIELLTRVKEGKAPKKIEINRNVYELRDVDNIQFMYTRKVGSVFDIEGGWYGEDITLDTKIKILPDRPIIPELPQINQNEYDTNSSYRSLVAYENRYKINEIIRHINNEENANEPK